MIVDKWEAPSSQTGPHTLDRLSQPEFGTNSSGPPLAPLLSSPTAGFPREGSEGPTLPWMPYLLSLEALGDPHSPVFLKLEGNDLSSMFKPRSPGKKEALSTPQKHGGNRVT